MDDSGFWLVVGVKDSAVALVPIVDVSGGEAVTIPEAAFEGQVPRTGEVLECTVVVESDGAAVQVETSHGSAIQRPLKAKKDGWEIAPPGGGPKTHIPFPDGLSQQQRSWAEHARFWLFPVSIIGLPGMFEDLETYLRKRVSAREAEQLEAEAHRWLQSRVGYDPDSFINPYNFVPLPEAPPVREVPSGHAQRRADRLHGWIDVEFRAVAPLLVRDSSSPLEDSATPFPRRRGQLTIPGSTVKGALRSAFETLTGSCLRVVDMDFVPAYRDVLHAGNKSSWRIIKVVAVDAEHRPTRVQISKDKPVWFSFEVLEKALGRGNVRTGTEFRYWGTPKTVGSGASTRAEARNPDEVAGADHAQGKLMVPLVTDTRTRRRNLGTCFVAAELGEELSVSVDAGGWRRFEAACDGLSDLKRGAARRGEEQSGEVPVQVRGLSHGVAYRQRQGILRGGTADVGLRPGHVLWARVSGDTIVDFSFAHTWRHGASGDHVTLESRIPQGFHPCTGVDGLCPACRVFGAADTQSKDGHSYRGHVLFPDWRVSGDVETVQLAPMGQPRAGAGQMYLQSADGAAGNLHRAGAGALPLREWGSDLDSSAPRMIRGRKYYWRTTDVPGRPPRYQRHRSQAGEENQGHQFKTVEVATAGSTVTGRLMFENLTQAEVGALIASLNPETVSGEQPTQRSGENGRFCFTIGGGKPLGLGALTAQKIEVTLEDAAGRYRGVPADPAESKDLVAAFTESTSQDLRGTWPAFLEMVRLDAVNPAMVGYPRTEPWPEKPESDSDTLYAPGLKWWTRSAGMPRDGIGSDNAEVQARHSYVMFPEPTASDVRMPIDIQDDAADTPRGHR